ncbi:bifunctional 4-hydroxy-2-oxoglutarate aldolase/2-dehydro-3-deoxy-phosphogluconate aldolase [Congregibacter litoralis]|uniref:2-dehydro-3-deoxy-phosphogluconate aldolase n=1 Tax=Congregibacter litoralis KT71 TaxID=314285 RepID=A4AD78_9GAMM|nr:bifunctional 4-hydroxy-2-oxoglutarate aldolase/2-dehydro-3-deoxy-phosphogluconate aldolase [Congregibacter litoralis]EAQ96002.1 2-keto-3-deoxy-phosphogluconate aldolase [Congregibacter litoralis KT71]
MNHSTQILAQAPVVPVLAIDNLDHAIPLARALVAGGIPVLEVTLRTPAGLPAITAIRDAVPDAIVGAGTVVNARDFDAAVEAGSAFVVTPGLTRGILDAAADSAVPLIPGVATVSEMMRALDHGVDCLKFFPAEASGGAAALKAFAGPFPRVKFCPTGGVGLHNIDDYLALESVVTVGGSWLTPSELLAAQDWDAIRALASAAVEHVTAFRAAQ